MYKCHKCNKEFKAEVGATKCPECHEDFIEIINNEEAKEQAKNNVSSGGIAGLFKAFVSGTRDQVQKLAEAAGGVVTEGAHAAYGVAGGVKPHVSKAISELYSIKDTVIYRKQTDQNGNRAYKEIQLKDAFIPIIRKFGLTDKNNPNHPATEEAINKLEESEVPNDAREKNPETGEEEKPSCHICMCDFEDKAVKAPCGHRYHKDCLFPWLRIHNRCPVCKVLVAK